MRQGREEEEERKPVRMTASADVALEGAPVTPPRFVDTLSDTQNEPAAMEIEAGISDLKVLYHDGKVSLPVHLSVQTSTGLHRGVHMSRLVQAASSSHASDIVAWLRGICKEVNKTQPGCSVTCRFEMPYGDQFVPISIKTSKAGSIYYMFRVNGMTACPCSKKMIGVGHMQRAEIEMIVGSRKPLDMLTLAKKIGECFSAMPTEKMKRIEEALKIMEAQDHARFAEDLVRECAMRFPNSMYVRARCFESIHAHDAVATWSRKSRWVPDF